jgi:hypothetical protein
MLESDVIQIFQEWFIIKTEGVWNPIHTFTVTMQMPVPSVLSFLLCRAAGFCVNVRGIWNNVLNRFCRVLTMAYNTQN